MSPFTGFLAQATGGPTETDRIVNLISGTQAVTTAIVGFIFVCLIFPRLVRVKPQFHAAVGMVLFLILLNSLAIVVNAAAFTRLVGAVDALLQFASILLLVLSTGGVSAAELREDALKTIEVVRRGGEKETIIVPLRGDQPRVRAEPEAQREDLRIEDYDLPPRPSGRAPEGGSSIPLE